MTFVAAPVVDENRLVNSVAEFPRDKWKANRWSPATWREQLRAYAGLRKHKFDWGLDLQGHSKTALALRIAKPKRRLAVGWYRCSGRAAESDIEA